MGNPVIEIKTLILLSMFDQIIKNDLLEEKELEFFEQKKKWYDQWRQEINKSISARDGENIFLDWERLKAEVVAWLRDNGDNGERESILEQCRRFIPYQPLPGWNGKSLDRIRLSPNARELTLEKACRLLGFEGDVHELCSVNL